MSEQFALEDDDHTCTTGELIQLNAAIKIGDLLRENVTVFEDHATVDVSELLDSEVINFRAAFNSLRAGEVQYDPVANWGVDQRVFDLAEQAIRNVLL